MATKKQRRPKYLMPKVRGRIPIEEMERAVDKVLAERRARKAMVRRSVNINRVAGCQVNHG